MIAPDPDVVDAVVDYVSVANFASSLGVQTVLVDTPEARAARSRAYADWGSAETTLVLALGDDPEVRARVFTARRIAHELADAKAREMQTGGDS